MHEIPVSVHEKVISELAPAMNQLRDALCEPLPPAGCLDISCFSSWLSDFGRQGEAVADSVETMGSAMLQWRGQVQTEEVLFRASHIVTTTGDISALHKPVLDAEFETRTVLLAITDRVFRDILGWYGRYRDVVRHPEDWQGREVELNLKLDLEEESEALHYLLEEKQLGLGTSLPHRQREGVGLPGLLTAFGLGIWLGGDD